MRKLFCILIAISIIVSVSTSVFATPKDEERALGDAIRFNWDIDVRDYYSGKPDITISKSCDVLSASDIDELGQVIYFAFEYCSYAYEDYSLSVYIFDNKSDSIQLLWSNKFGTYGNLIDKRSGEIEVIIMSSVEDLCKFFPALSREINESKMDKSDIQIYTEVMAELNSRMSESEEEILNDLAPKYDMTYQQLSIFMKDVMQRIYSKNADISGKVPIIYPALTESSSFGHFNDAPDIIYNTPASENGKEGEIYSVIGEVSEYGSFSSEGHDMHFFIINTDKGPVMFMDIYSFSISMCNEYEFLEKFISEPSSDYTFPCIGDYVKVYGVYQGYSRKYNMPLFCYGIPYKILWFSGN